MEIVIRKAFKEDEPRVLNVQYHGWLSAYSHFLGEDNIKKFFSENKFNNLEFRKRNAAMIENNPYFYIACQGDDIVAIACFNYMGEDDENEAIELGGFYCLPELQRMGIGTKLFNFMKDIAKTAGYKKLIIKTPKQNNIGLGFYKKSGAKLIDEIKTSIIGQDIIEVIMEIMVK